MDKNHMLKFIFSLNEDTCESFIQYFPQSGWQSMCIAVNLDC